MQFVHRLFALATFVGFMSAGLYAILEVFIPALRGPDFNRWEVDEESGSYVQIMGWRKMLQPPRVLAQGYMSNSAACITGLLTGVIFFLIGVAGIRHVAGVPRFLPDLVGRFLSH